MPRIQQERKPIRKEKKGKETRPGRGTNYHHSKSFSDFPSIFCLPMFIFLPLEVSFDYSVISLLSFVFCEIWTSQVSKTSTDISNFYVGLSL